MAPIFSPRSLLGIFLGILIGVFSGIGYSNLNNASAGLTAGWPPIEIRQNPVPIVYESTIQGRVMPALNDETFIRNMDQQEQYYAAKMESWPFFQYLSLALYKQYPQYAHKPEELSTMLKIKFVILADNPSVIEIKATSTSPNEPLFMAQYIPIVFETYLLNEQNNLQAEEYRKKLSQIEATRTALAKAGQDLVDATILDETPPVILTKEYLEIDARVNSLQNELDAQAKQAASLLAQGSTPVTTPPAGQLAQRSTPISPQSAVPYAPIATPNGTAALTREETNPAALEAKVRGIVEALRLKAWVAAGFTLSVGASSSSLSNAQLIAEYQNAEMQIYINSIAGMERTSTELSKAKIEMDKIQAQINQEKAAKDSANEQKKLAYTFASTRIASLIAHLDAQTKELQMMSPTVPTSQISRFYIVEAPRIPAPVGSKPNYPLVGGLIGMFCGWLAVNIRWLAGSSISPQPLPQPAVYEEEEYVPPVKAPPKARPGQADLEDLNEVLNSGTYAPAVTEKQETDEEWFEKEIRKKTQEMRKAREVAQASPPAQPQPEPEEEFPDVDFNITPEGNPLKEIDKK
jgi:hypothetical protein